MSGRTREESIRSETLGRFSPKAKVRKIKIDFEALARLGNPNPEERKREKRRRARQNKRERKLAELKEAMKASGVESKDKDSEISKLISEEEDSSQVRKRRKLQEERESEVIRRGLFRSRLGRRPGPRFSREREVSRLNYLNFYKPEAQSRELMRLRSLEKYNVIERNELFRKMLELKEEVRELKANRTTEQTFQSQEKTKEGLLKEKKNKRKAKMLKFLDLLEESSSEEEERKKRLNNLNNNFSRRYTEFYLKIFNKINFVFLFIWYKVYVHKVKHYVITHICTLCYHKIIKYKSGKTNISAQRVRTNHKIKPNLNTLCTKTKVSTKSKNLNLNFEKFYFYFYLNFYFYISFYFYYKSVLEFSDSYTHNRTNKKDKNKLIRKLSKKLMTTQEQ